MTRAAACLLTIVAGLAGQTRALAPDALLARYCTGCHNDKLKTAGVSLTAVRTTDVAAGAATFEKVLRKMRTGEMPPNGLPAPDAAARAQFVSWLESQLDRAAAVKPNPGNPGIHRLNRAEYSNAIRDLLALDMDHSAGLPADDSGYGFDNIGGVLTVSPLLLEKYMSTARRVSRLAVGTVKLSRTLEKYSAGRGNAEILEDMPLSTRAGLVVRRYFPLDSEYSIVVRVRGTPAPNTPAPKLDVRVDGRRIKLVDVNIDTAEQAQDTRNQVVRLPIDAGTHVIGAAFLSESAKLESGAGGRGRGGAAAPPQFAGVSVESISIGGPLTEAKPGNTESRRRIFVCRPSAGEPEEPCSSQILQSLARRAYRRPVNQADLAPLMKLFAQGRVDGGSFDAGIETALRAILVSPNFLFRVERDPARATRGSVYRVTDLELASRLSFFLWSSVPDDELLQTAEQNKLHEPAVLNRQVMRMLADSKSKALVENFAGQWLQLRNIATWKPDPDKFPGFDDPLRDALRRETELFFQYVIHEDRSVLDLLSADYTFLNERLARHYGIEGVRGPYFRRVHLTSPERGGILTQGSVLTVTSQPTRTSPVVRGKWILENVLGAPPPPPPPDVPALNESAAVSAKSLRELFEKHRENAMCASCHVRLDPLGFALENYDAIGRFRTKDGDAEIDASGSLPNGTVIRGPEDLKKVLLDRRDEFVEAFAEKLLTYALGRGVEYYDYPAVRKIRSESAKQEYKFSSIALAIVNSLPFQMRRTTER